MSFNARPRFVFVFGSNTAGQHGGGAAREAYDNYGAEWGVGEGPTGNSYAIPTKYLAGKRVKNPKTGKFELIQTLETSSYSDVGKAVARFIGYAEKHPDTIFFVTPIGCGLAGMDWDKIKAMFKSAPNNCVGPFFYNS